MDQNSRSVIRLQISLTGKRKTPKEEQMEAEKEGRKKKQLIKNMTKGEMRRERGKEWVKKKREGEDGAEDMTGGKE